MFQIKEENVTRVLLKNNKIFIRDWLDKIMETKF